MHDLDRVCSQGIIRVGCVLLAKLIKTQIWHSLCLTAVLGEGSKKISGPCYHFCLSALTLMPDSTVPSSI